MASFRSRLDRFFESNFFWGAVAFIAGVTIMQSPAIALFIAWFTLSVGIWRTDFFAGVPAPSSRYLGNITLSVVVGLLLIFLSKHLPSYLGQAPSVGIDNVELRTNQDINEVCFLVYLRNTGTALAHTDFFQHQITIADKLYPSIPSIVDDKGDFAANGGGGRYKLCVHNAEAFRQVSNKATTKLDFGFRYHGDSGPTKSLCMEGAEWDYSLKGLGGSSESCLVSADDLAMRDTLVWSWAAVIFGAIILSALVTLLVIRFGVTPSASQRAASWRDNADEFSSDTQRKDDKRSE